MGAGGANNVVAEFGTIAETDPAELFSKQLGIQWTRQSSILLNSTAYHWSLDALGCPFISAPVIRPGARRPRSLDSKLLAKELWWVSLSNGVKLGHNVVGTGGLHGFFTCQVHAQQASLVGNLVEKSWPSPQDCLPISYHWTH